MIVFPHEESFCFRVLMTFAAVYLPTKLARELSNFLQQFFIKAKAFNTIKVVEGSSFLFIYLTYSEKCLTKKTISTLNYVPTFPNIYRSFCVTNCNEIKSASSAIFDKCIY